MNIIAVDDDCRILKRISELLGTHCEVQITTDPAKALSWLEKRPTVRTFLVAETVRGESGVALLKSAQQLRPEVLRVLMTGYADLPNIVSGLHTGVIDRLLSKPLVASELSAVVATMEPRNPTNIARPLSRRAV